MNHDQISQAFDELIAHVVLLRDIVLGEPTAPTTPEPPVIYSSVYPHHSDELLERHQIRRARFIPGATMAPPNPRRPSPSIDEWINENVDADFDGLLCIDMEGWRRVDDNGHEVDRGHWLISLRRGPTDPAYTATVESFREALERMRAMRPNATVTAYGLVPKRRMDKGQSFEDWVEQVENCRPVIEMCDVVLISMYDVEPGEQSGIVEEQADLATTFGKPVGGIVQHRYKWNGRKRHSFALIPKGEFQDHLDGAIRGGASFFVVWGPDGFRRQQAFDGVGRDEHDDLLDDPTLTVAENTRRIIAAELGVENPTDAQWDAYYEATIDTTYAWIREVTG